MINIQEITHRMTRNAEVIRALAHTFSDEQARWKPNSEAWSMQQTLEHLYNEERIDFRKHLREMFSDPPQPWGEWRREEFVTVESCGQALEGFLAEREASIAWLHSLESPNWDATSSASFGLAGEVLVLSAGDVLTSWAAHDFLHIRQLNELLYAWNEKQASPYSVQYAGGW